LVIILKSAVLKIIDQVNVKFDGLEPQTRRKISEACKYFVPYARHMPAFKLGRWDGKIAFASIGGTTFLNMLDRILPIVIEDGYEIDVNLTIEDHRPSYQFEFPEVTDDMLAHKTWPVGHPMEGDPIMLRDYQVEAIKRYLDNLQSVQSISTGAGKTLMTATMSHLIEAYGRSVVIVPSKSLVEQTEEDYKNLGLDVGVFFGDRKEWGHTHTICTWQSLGAFSKKTKAGDADIPIQDFLDGVVCVMVDEVHSAKADVLKDLLTGPMAHIPIRWGLTGTIPKEEFEYMSLVVSLGPVVGEIKASDLQDQGVLSRCEVEVIQLQDEGEYGTYHDEYEYLTTNPTRLQWIADKCKVIAENGNTLILVDRIETGEFLRDAIGDGAVFISGKVKTKDRKKEYTEVQTAEGKIIIATYGVAAVGINIPRIFNLVMIEAGKSFVRVIQSIGRGIRKAADKDFVQIYDLTSSMKFSARHLTKRKGFYRDANYPFKVVKVKYK
jgi:superfamily II DNA or RNA helicase